MANSQTVKLLNGQQAVE